jgi:hypothetical protein
MMGCVSTNNHTMYHCHEILLYSRWTICVNQQFVTMHILMSCWDVALRACVRVRVRACVVFAFTPSNVYRCAQILELLPNSKSKFCHN